MAETSQRTVPEQARPSRGWQRSADELSRYGWLALLASVVVAIVGGAMIATLQSGGDDTGGGGTPSRQDIPVILSTLGYGLAILLSLPSLLAGVWDLVRDRRFGGA